jgi:ribonuclease HII
MLLPYFAKNDDIEIGVDESGRGPLFGRVYTAAVILPKDGSFDTSRVKDSKKFTSEKKLLEAYEYVIENAAAVNVSFEDAYVVDTVNIRNATFKCMHQSIRKIITMLDNDSMILQSERGLGTKCHLLIDGNDFKPFIYTGSTYTGSTYTGSTYTEQNKFYQIPHTCIEKGDSLYASIAAASILAKVERDQYIKELCEDYPKLDEYYNLSKNKGYGAAKHLEGILQHGITKWHRKSFNRCKGETIIDLTPL